MERIIKFFGTKGAHQCAGAPPLGESSSSWGKAPGAGTGSCVGAARPPPFEEEARDLLSTSLKVDLSTLHRTATVTIAPANETGASFEVERLTIESEPADRLIFTLEVTTWLKNVAPGMGGM